LGETGSHNRQLALFSSLFSVLTRARSSIPARRASRPRVPRQVRPQVSDARLFAVWEDVARRYFPTRIDLLDYSVHWSPRPQRRTLASCNISKKRILVARELTSLEHQERLEPLLYHEMCHAVLGKDVGYMGSKRAWHGPRFRALERKHPAISALNEWIRSGGWAKAVRSDRARAAALARYRGNSR
jgi:predicted metal-dependent hydrolase